MSKLEFNECDISGHLRAEGDKGTYWVIDGAWTHLQRVTTTHAGPEIERLGAYYSEEGAIEEANKLDQESNDE